MNHFWLKATNVPMDIGSRYNLPSQIGAGDIRIHRNAYVVAPGSKLPEGEYKFIQGSIESFSAQPIIEWKDLIWLLPSYANGLVPISNDEIIQLPLRLIYRDEPKILYYLTKLLHAKKSERISKSRPLFRRVP